MRGSVCLWKLQGRELECSSFLHHRAWCSELREPLFLVLGEDVELEYLGRSSEEATHRGIDAYVTPLQWFHKSKKTQRHYSLKNETCLPPYLCHQSVHPLSQSETESARQWSKSSLGTSFTLYWRNIQPEVTRFKGTRVTYALLSEKHLRQRVPRTRRNVVTTLAIQFKLISSSSG